MWKPRCKNPSISCTHDLTRVSKPKQRGCWLPTTVAEAINALNCHPKSCSSLGLYFPWFHPTISEQNGSLHESNSWLNPRPRVPVLLRCVMLRGSKGNPWRRTPRIKITLSRACGNIVTSGDWIHLVTSTWQPLPFAKAPTAKTTMNPSKVDGNGGESYHKRSVGWILYSNKHFLFSLASLQLFTLRDENFPFKKNALNVACHGSEASKKCGLNPPTFIMLSLKVYHDPPIKHTTPTSNPSTNI